MLLPSSIEFLPPARAAFRARQCAQVLEPLQHEVGVTLRAHDYFRRLILQQSEYVFAFSAFKGITLTRLAHHRAYLIMMNVLKYSGKHFGPTPDVPILSRDQLRRAGHNIAEILQHFPDGYSDQIVIVTMRASELFLHASIPP